MSWTQKAISHRQGTDLSALLRAANIDMTLEEIVGPPLAHVKRAMEARGLESWQAQLCIKIRRRKKNTVSERTFGDFNAGFATLPVLLMALSFRSWLLSLSLSAAGVLRHGCNDDDDGGGQNASYLSLAVFSSHTR